MKRFDACFDKSSAGPPAGLPDEATSGVGEASLGIGPATERCTKYLPERTNRSESWLR